MDKCTARRTSRCEKAPKRNGYGGFLTYTKTAACVAQSITTHIFTPLILSRPSPSQLTAVGVSVVVILVWNHSRGGHSSSSSHAEGVMGSYVDMHSHTTE